MWSWDTTTPTKLGYNWIPITITSQYGTKQTVEETTAETTPVDAVMMRHTLPSMPIRIHRTTT